MLQELMYEHIPRVNNQEFAPHTAVQHLKTNQAITGNPDFQVMEQQQ
jgi:hypothetical protein